MSNKKNRKHKTLFVVLGVLFLSVLVVAGAFGYKLYSDTQQEEALNKEVALLSKLDLTKDNYNRKLKTSGDYGKVEKTIKDYLVDFQKSFKAFEEKAQDEKITSILSYENYKKDGPEFKESIAYLDSTSDELEKLFDELISKCEEKNIMAAIEKEKLDQYYVDLYKKLLVGDMSSDLEDAKKSLEDSKKMMLDLLKIEKEVLVFLKDNKSKWELDEDQIVFSNQKSLEKYNEYLEKLNKLG